MKHALPIAVVVLCAASFGCGQAGALSDRDRAAILKLHDDFARAQTAQKPDIPALVRSSYTQDAKVLPPNALATQGEEAIIRVLSPGAPLGSSKYTNVKVEGRGDLAFAQGGSEVDWTTPGGQLAHGKGKFLTVLRRQADGSWKIAYDIWNSDAPPAGVLVATGALKAGGRPELNALQWFTGTWQMDVDLRESPLSPKGKSVQIVDCRWFASGEHVICTAEGTMPAGPYHEVLVMGHDAETKAYKGYDLDNAGLMNPFVLTFKDRQWILDYDLKIGGKPVKLRVTGSDVTADSCSVKQEFSTGGPWTLAAEGKMRKTAS